MIVDYDIVLNTYYNIRGNIRNKKKVIRFEILLNSNINYLVDSINNNTYKLSKYNIFIIHEKKYRVILSNNIFDKIYNHLVSNLILSKLDKYLINSNTASRVNKGINYSRYLLWKYLIKVKENDFYILKFDIKKYFFNIDHDILLKLLSKYLNVDELLIIKNILDSTNLEYINTKINYFNNKYNLDLPSYSLNKGLSIGSVCSQMLAVFYLNEFDHFIKEKLNCKYYIRYMDDGIIIDNDKERLKKVFNVLKELIKKYKLEFNNKTRIYNSTCGFNFLGINYYVINKRIIKRISKRNKKKIIKKINYNNYKFYKNYLKYIK